MSSTFESIFLQALSLSETSRHALAMALLGSLKSPAAAVEEPPKKVAEQPKKVAEQVQQDSAESTKALASKIPYEQTLCVECNRVFGGDHRRCFFSGGFNSEREWVEASQLYTLKTLSQSEREALEPKVVQPPKETAAAEQPKEKALSDWQVHLAYVREGLYSADLCDEDKHLVKTGPCVMQIAKALKADGKQNIFTHKELLAALEAWKAVSPEEREAQKAAKKAEKETKRAAKESAKQTKEVKKADDAATDTESTTSSEKKKRVWTEEQKAKAKATREANKAKKAAGGEEGL